MLIQQGCFGGASLKKRVPKEYLGAFKAGHRHAARAYIDEEFSFQLLKRVEQGCAKAKEALEWLVKFNNEHYRGVYKLDGTDFNATKEERKKLRHERYARDEDVMAAQTLELEMVEIQTTEDELITLIDLKIEKERSTGQ